MCTTSNQVNKKLLANVKHVFLDMDDTIYCGTTLFPTTKPFLEFLMLFYPIILAIAPVNM